MEAKCTLQSPGIEEAQSANDLVIARAGQFILPDQKQAGTDECLWLRLISGAMKCWANRDVREVHANGSSGVVARLELFQHALMKLGPS
jgi:hypothetical protein